MKRVLLISIMGVLGFLPAQVRSNDLFQPHEMSVDFHGFFATRDKNGSGRDAWGYGAGFNYFFTENFGLGADTYSDAFTVPYMLNTSGIYRYPIRNANLAPYGFAGFGRQWDHEAQWHGYLGGGVEYRWKPGMGFFGDIRWVIPGETSNYTVIRFGFRFVLGR
jgi:hypothetical protein